jgi:predicted metallopeptidase
MIQYAKAPDVEEEARAIVLALRLDHIDLERIQFYRSIGSRSRGVQARIHGLGRIWFDALQLQPRYIVEVIAEKFDRLDERERQKVIIHELMHIPAAFSGGFVPHKGRITKKKVETLYENYLRAARSVISNP